MKVLEMATTLISYTTPPRASSTNLFLQDLLAEYNSIFQRFPKRGAERSASYSLKLIGDGNSLQLNITSRPRACSHNSLLAICLLTSIHSWASWAASAVSCALTSEKAGDTVSLIPLQISLLLALGIIIDPRQGIS